MTDEPVYWEPFEARFVTPKAVSDPQPRIREYCARG
jgi:hypothetical protein